MKNWLIFLVLVVAAGWAFGGHATECRDVLTRESVRSVQYFSIDTDDYEIRDYGRDHVAWAIRMVRLLLEEQGCARDEVNFGRGNFGRSKNRCQHIAAPKDESLVCYIETNLGYFIVTPSYGSEVSLVYHLWD